MLDNVNKAFENRVRLGIMSTLMVNDWLDFGTIKDMLDVTDGNLSSHMQALEKLNYLKVRKEFVARRPKTSYQVTKLGKEEFTRHLTALEKLLKGLT